MRPRFYKMAKSVSSRSPFCHERVFLVVVVVVGLSLWSPPPIAIVHAAAVVVSSAEDESGSSASSQQGMRLLGAGASFPREVYKEWMATYVSLRRPFVDLEMVYDVVGSTAGKSRIKGEHGEYVDFAGSDSPLSQQDLQDFPDLTMLPMMAGAVVMGYNLPELQNSDGQTTHTLVLSLDALISIYNGTIQFWNDTVLQGLNRNVTLPAKKIILLARGDKSGTTEIFTRALSQSPIWRSTYGVFAMQKWPNDTVTYYGYTNRGIAGLLVSFKYSLGYLSIADAHDVHIPHADMLNLDGQLVDADTKSVQETMDAVYLNLTEDLTVSLVHRGNSRSYAIIGFTYLIIRNRTASKTCAAMRELVRFIHWAMNDSWARDKCASMMMTPLSDKMVARVHEQILSHVVCAGENVWASVLQQIAEETGGSGLGGATMIATISATLLSAIFIVVASFLAVRYVKYRRMLSRNEWEIDVEDIVFYQTATNASSPTCNGGQYLYFPSLTSLTDLDTLDQGQQMLEHVLQWPGKWNSHTIGLRLYELKQLKRVKDATKVLLLSMREMSHANLLKFHGLVQVENSRYVVGDYGTKGPLNDILKNTKYHFNDDFKFSISLEIATGLSYLHSKGFVHGHLRTSCCLIDFKWTVKIADWEFCRLFRHLDNRHHPVLFLRKNPDEVGQNEAAFSDYWTAPEIIKSEMDMFPTVYSDVYSYGIIAQEVFTRKEPYAEHADGMAARDVIKAVINNNLRPVNDDRVPSGMWEIMELAWSDDPLKRPTGENIVKMLRCVHAFKRGVVDSMMQSTEEYTCSLEAVLSETREQLFETKEALRSLLARSVPSEMTNILTDSHRSPDKAISRISVSVLCVRCSVETSKSKLWTLYNNLDVLLENLIQDHDGVCRLDFLTGTFMLVFGVHCGKGLGVKTHAHSAEAASFAYRLLDSSGDLFQDTNKPAGLQIGLHRGPLHACVLDSTVPKCLFLGDTIDVSYCLARRSQTDTILVSSKFAEALKAISQGTYVLEEKTTTNSLDSEQDPPFWLSKAPSRDFEQTTSLPVIV